MFVVTPTAFQRLLIPVSAPVVSPKISILSFSVIPCPLAVNLVKPDGTPVVVYGATVTYGIGGTVIE